MSTIELVLIRVGDFLDEISWPVASLVPDEVEDLLIQPPRTDPDSGEMTVGVFLERELSLTIPGMEVATLALSPIGSGSLIELSVGFEPFSIGISATVVLRVDADVLRPIVSGTDEPDMSVDTFDISLGEVDIGIDVDGNISVDTGAASMPRCMVGTSGVILGIGALRWLSPGDGGLPPRTPQGFTGLYLDDVEVNVPALPELGHVRMDDVFLGTGGFSGVVNDTFDLGWDENSQQFTGDLNGELFGFQGALKSVSIEFYQSALVGCDITGDVLIPFLDARIGLDMGLTGDGSVSAIASVPHSGGPVTAGSGNHLLDIEVLDLLDFSLDAIRFEAPAGAPAFVELQGDARLTIPGLEMPAVGVQALRIDTAGKVDVDGGWLDVSEGGVAVFNGFPLEISRLGFGSNDDSGSTRNWVGLNGGLKLADGLPVGASVEGLRVSWDPASADVLESVAISLDGVGLELDVPGAVVFDGSVSFTTEGGGSGFTGHGSLTIIPIGVSIDVNVVVGRAQTGETYFYFHLGVELPAGIPLFSTGAAFFGFEGLVANNMGPDRADGEPWYHGWYVRAPRGATNAQKWAVDVGAFAIGAGTTLGTFADDGYTVNTSVLLILVLPGPVLLLEGKGSFLTARKGGGEGNFEALLVLDVPSKLFEANLAVAYEVDKLIDLTGSADVAFSWAKPPPPNVWHVYLGEKSPMSRRWRAEFLQIFRANSYFMVDADRMALGSWVGFDEYWDFGPVHVWAKADIEGEGEVSWNPEHFFGRLILGGEVGVSAFGARIVMGAWAFIEAQGPTPWTLAFDLRAYIEIDLWLFSFSWSHTIHLEWGNRVLPKPQPALPIVSEIAAEHMLVSGGGPLDGATVPPDGRPLILFNRPVRDLGELGVGGSRMLAPEPVSPNNPVAKYSYRLGHVILVRKSGGDHVIAAAGHATVSGSSLSLPGVTANLALTDPALGAVGDAQIEIVGGQQYDVTGGGVGVLQLDRKPGGDEVRYRLRGARPEVDVRAVDVIDIGNGMARLTLDADPLVPVDALGGGTLTMAGAETYQIVGNNGDTISVRYRTDLPVLGHGRATGPPGPTLEGVWLPAEDRPEATPTKLLIGVRTPFALFRNNVESVSQTFADYHPDYACGPEVVEEPVCSGFDSLPLGPLAGTFSVPLLEGSAGPVGVSVQPGSVADSRRVRVGDGSLGGGHHGSVEFFFDPPVADVRVRCNTEEGGVIRAFDHGQLIAEHLVPRELAPIRITGNIDRVAVEGSLVSVHEVCYLPGWTCTTFDAATFPNGQSGAHNYAGLILSSAGKMRVNSGILRVEATKLSAVKQPPYGSVLTRSGTILPYGSAEARRRIGPVSDTTAPGERSRLAVPGLAREAVTRIPGLGQVTVIPGGSPGRATTVRRPISAHGVRFPPEPKVVVTVAALTIHLPRPVTRARVALRAQASIAAYAGTRLVDHATAGHASNVAVTSRDGWFDRIVVTAKRQVSIDQVCIEAGDLGWRRFQQWTWQERTRRSVESFYQESPVLAPGDYRLDVVTGWADVRATEDAPTTWTTDSAHFTVGPPPGLESGGGETYPGGGPLNYLSTYVARTLPAPGQRPFYRSHDIAVEFSQDYVSRMYLGADSALTIAVVDANAADVRVGTQNLWGQGRELAISAEEETWIRTLHNEGTSRCASIDLARVRRTEAVSAGAGELLRPASLHRAEIRAGTTAVFAFDFVTSRYASFAHHIAAFDGRLQRIDVSSTADAAGFNSDLRAAVATWTAAASQLAATTSAVQTGSAGDVEFEAWHAATDNAAEAHDQLQVARENAFAATLAALGVPDGRPAPQHLEVSAAGNVILIESDEPLDWDRLDVEITRTDAVPQQRRIVTFDPTEVGSPDVGTFRHRGIEWTTSAELWGRHRGAASRVGTAWTLDFDVVASRVDLVAHLPPGESATIEGLTPPAGPVTFNTEDMARVQRESLALAGRHRLRASLSPGTALLAVEIVGPWRPVAPSGPVRISSVRLPESNSDHRHFVEVIAFADTDLTGWRLDWSDAVDPKGWSSYHRFASSTTLKDGRVARIYGHGPPPNPPAGLDIHTGGTVGIPPSTGLILRLVDPTGVVRAEAAAMPQVGSVAVNGYVIVPNGDGTRAFLIAPGDRIEPGWWTLAFTYHRDAGAGLHVLSVGGDTSPEHSSLSFAVLRP